MSSKWKEYTLENCMESIIDYRGKTPKKTTSGIPLITAKIVKNGRILSVTEYIAEIDYDSWMVRGIPQEGDIVMTTEAPLGEIAQLDNRKVALAQRIITLRGKDNILDNNYLKYAMQSKHIQDQLTGRATGTTVKGIKQKELRKISFNLPPLPEQKRIAKILGDLDDKIEVNRRMNETLEGMAQALFKSWFVDFDPVIDNALDAGNDIPEELAPRAALRQELKTKGEYTPLPKETRSLFPASFTHTPELGWIPEGWEVKTVSELISINPKTLLKKGTVAKFLEMKSIPSSGFSVSNISEKEFKGGVKFTQGDILLARITPCLENGKTAIVDFLNSEETGFGSTELIVLRGNEIIKTPFIACLSRFNDFRNHCIKSMIGTSGRQRVQNSCFDNFFLPIPKNKVISEFQNTTKQYFSKITSNSSEIESLQSLRNIILPKLIAGKVGSNNNV